MIRENHATVAAKEGHTNNAEEPAAILVNDQEMQSRLEIIRRYVSQPIPKQPFDDSSPALIPLYDTTDDINSPYCEISKSRSADCACSKSKSQDIVAGGGIIIGSARHAANIPLLQSMNVIAVLNCASGGIARLPVAELKECGIRYTFTNCRQDSYNYPILHEKKKADKENGACVATGEQDVLTEKYICSQHLEVSNSLYADIRRINRSRLTVVRKQPIGNVLFFCVAGQNRSAALAVATLMIHGKPLEDILRHCWRQRPFVLENIGFQRQLVELEAILNRLKHHDQSSCPEQLLSHWKLLLQATQLAVSPQCKRIRVLDKNNQRSNISVDEFLHDPPSPAEVCTKPEPNVLAENKVEIELLIPGLCTMEVLIPVDCTISTLKKHLIQHANENLLRHDEYPARVAKSWVVLAMFGFDDMYDIPLEIEAVELKVQLERMHSMFGLAWELKDGEPHVTWNERCRFALVIFSVTKISRPVSSDPTPGAIQSELGNDQDEDSIDLSSYPCQEPWTFIHEERPSAPATLLENTLRSTHLRAWDFVTGEALASKIPTVFSFAEDPRDRRAFMMVSRSANTLQQFHAPGEGDILGMGENAIVHRVQLKFTQADGGHRDEGWTEVNVGLRDNSHVDHHHTKATNLVEEERKEDWDAAVKRPFSLPKMLVFLQKSSEAGLAKRLRLANLLNSDGRVLYFYGLGLGLSTNAYNQNQYKFEAMLLAKYEENFSTYTMRRFMEEYVVQPTSIENQKQQLKVRKMQEEFSITSVKVFLVSLLNAFRDLTLMGVQAFDFNHLNNVLVSRDFRNVRLIDIDGNSQGSINYPSIDNFPGGSLLLSSKSLHKPSLDIDLNILLPSVVERLILGKGRGMSFVSNSRSKIWRANEDDGKVLVKKILLENFYSIIGLNGAEDDLERKAVEHTTKVAEWFYTLLKKKSPWTNWTNDIYDAMRCIDHLPIS